MRAQDAVPDELEIIPDNIESRPSSSASQPNRSASAGDRSIPQTVVEKVDPTSPSHGDVPGTAAYSLRKADAVPDVILQTPERGRATGDVDRDGATSPEIPVPKTVITKIDSNPSHGEVPGTDAFNLRKGDARPDVIEKRGDVSGKQG